MYRFPCKRTSVQKRYDVCMGQRDDLLAGARTCLAEKGLGRTTARDIAAASGANLASIGYHFGSKDNLMNIAVLDAVNELGDAVETAVRSADGDSPAERMQVALDEVHTMLGQERGLMVASVHAYSQALFSDEVRRSMVDSIARGRGEMAAMILGVSPDELDPDRAQRLGSVVHNLIIGITFQYLLDPDSLPSGEEFVSALQVLASGVEPSLS